MLDLTYIRTPEKEQLKNLIVIEKVLPLIEENKEQSLDKHGWEIDLLKNSGAQRTKLKRNSFINLDQGTPGKYYINLKRP